MKDIAPISALFLLLGCTPDDLELSASASGLGARVRCESGLCFDVAVDPDFERACPRETQIAVLESPPEGEGVCPAPPEWSSRPLFPSASVDELRRFCVYEWSGRAAMPPGVEQALAVQIGALRVDPDCEVVAPLAPPLEDAHAQDFEDAFRAQLEALSTFPVTPSLDPTKVVVVDSATDSEFPRAGSGVLAHGQDMAQIIGKLACPSVQSCRAEVSTRLALALNRDASGKTYVDEQNGGFYGSQGYLANAIVEAAQHGVASSSRGFIINLSLGWDPRWGGPYPGTHFRLLRAPVQAVHTALTYASCQGAVVIASAGNDPAGPAPSTGPFYPAGWEQKPAPDAARCGALGGRRGPAAVAAYQPLVYAAAGVDGADRRLANSPAGSQSPLVAPADHAVMTEMTPAGRQRTATYTGSSVAAAGLSAVAAVGWSYLPTLAGADLIEVVRASAVSLGRTPDFCGDPACPATIRRVSICRTVADACANVPGCATIPSCGPAVRDLRPSGLDYESFTRTAMVSLTGTATVVIYDPCRAPICFDPSGTPRNPCPKRQYYSQYATPYANPLPNVPICPDCAGLLNGDVVIAISHDVSESLSDPTVTVTYEHGDEVFPLSLASEALTSGAVIEVTDTGFDFKSAQAASVDFVVDGKFVVSDPLLIQR